MYCIAYSGTLGVPCTNPYHVHLWHRASPTALSNFPITFISHQNPNITLFILQKCLLILQKCLSEVEASRWFEMVNADKIKCEAFVEKLYSQALLGLTHATIQESFNDPFTAQPELMFRYTALRCQAVSITVIRIILHACFYGLYF